MSTHSQFHSHILLDFLVERNLETHTVKKKVSDFPIARRDVTNQNLPGREIIKSFPPRESLISDILAGDGKIDNLFFTVQAATGIALIATLPRLAGRVGQWGMFCFVPLRHRSGFLTGVGVEPCHTTARKLGLL